MFGRFQTYVCAGDSVDCQIDGITYTARIEVDDSSDKPDQRDDGFWPSLKPSSAGFIGHKSQATLRRHTARAKEIMQSWLNDEWFYCGVVISAAIEDDDGKTVSLGDHLASLWGIECNYPTFTKSQRKRSNSFISECANDLLSEAIEQATDAKSRIHAATA